MSVLKSWLTMGIAILVVAESAAAAIQTETVTYQDQGVELKGYLAWDDTAKSKRPGVIVVHEWWGLNDYARERARMLAELGYVAFAVDMYGDDKVTTHPDQAGAWMTEITENIAAWRRRAQAGRDLLAQQDWVDANKIAAIGYCFGGATVMQMAYAGTGLKGVASFHGSLPVATVEQARAIKSAVYVAHGEADNFVPAERVAAFQSALNDAGVDLQFASFPDARHSFTNPGADALGMENLRYHKDADQQSWQQLQKFFNKIFN